MTPEECWARAYGYFQIAVSASEPDRSKYFTLAKAWLRLANDGKTEIPPKLMPPPAELEPTKH